jgi:hypothetical protein
MGFLNLFFWGENGTRQPRGINATETRRRISSRRFRYKRRLEAGEVLNIQWDLLFSLQISS